MPTPELIAHRGVPRERPENTLPGFMRALEAGAGGIELDVHATADGVVVVHHDPVPRAVTTKSALAGRPIARLSHLELRTFRVEGTTPIPTLAEVLAAVADRATVYVEIKGAGIEARVLDVIAAAACRCAIHSFDHAQVLRVRRAAPTTPTGALVTERPPSPARLLADLGARDLWPEWPIIDASLVEAVHEGGGRVIAWTVNDAAAARRLAAIAVDGICTDRVAEIGAALGGVR
ncbi:MAG TPA: glycerophosphodiester phosphodiesterase [Gemmatimonadaceae bacterium]|nr:glycerophosphodiester phosphodiesterase [Gemmatimonadaceae bacterium]